MSNLSGCYVVYLVFLLPDNNPGNQSFWKLYSSTTLVVHPAKESYHWFFISRVLIIHEGTPIFHHVMARSALLLFMLEHLQGRSQKIWPLGSLQDYVPYSFILVYQSMYQVSKKILIFWIFWLVWLAMASESYALMQQVSHRTESIKALSRIRFYFFIRSFCLSRATWID